MGFWKMSHSLEMQNDALVPREGLIAYYYIKYVFVSEICMKLNEVSTSLRTPLQY